jgi:curved DNA-binding protein CbpA
MKKFLLLCLILAYTICVLAEEDYYKILGVPRDADERQIKKAFNKLSLKYHPDKNKGDEEKARAQFVKIAQAYEALSDPEKRKIYDQHGEEGLKRKEAGGDPHGGGFQGGFDDMFNNFFRGGGGHFHFNMGGGGRHGGHHHHQREEPHEELWQQSDVIELGMGSISSFYRRNEVWLILFYKSNDKSSKAYKDVWREIAEKMYGIIKVAAINCHEEAEEALCEDFSVYDIPKVLCFPANSRLDPITYNGELKYSSLAGFAVSFMESFVKLVNDQNYEEFVHEDYDKTKVILFTAKKSTPPLLKALSKDFKGRVVFGEVRQSSEKLINKFQVTNFPSLVVLSDGLNYQGVVYQGDFKKDQLAKFLREHSSSQSSKKASKNPLGGVLKELMPSMVNNGPCSPNDSNLCLLAILDRSNSADSQSLKSHLEKLAPSFSDDPIQFFFVSSGNIDYSYSFENINRFPALVIVKPKRGRYTHYQGSFDLESLKTFIESTISGSSQFVKMKADIFFSNKNTNSDL